MTHTFTIPGRPIPWSRARKKGNQFFNLARMTKAKRDIATLARAAGVRLMDGPVGMEISATFGIPKSWSKAKKRAASWHTSKPDADNIEKLIKDALKGVAYKDDAQVAFVINSKRYGPDEGTEVRVWAL